MLFRLLLTQSIGGSLSIFVAPWVGLGIDVRPATLAVDFPVLCHQNLVPAWSWNCETLLAVEMVGLAVARLGSGL